ncbi:non-specific serine/threonine protein kinase [Entamoeba marina]
MEEQQDYKQLLQSFDSYNLISQGAEAELYTIPNSTPPLMIKRRFPKSYRTPSLDKSMNRRRVRNEVRTLQRFKELNLPCPKFYFTQNLDIIMEYIDGNSLKSFIDKEFNGTTYSDATFKVVSSLGRILGEMHSKGFCHGDLTTSNFMVTSSNEIVIIDFGLSNQSETIEDMAVDLYVLERALLCTHHNAEQLFKCIIDGYLLTAKKGRATITHLDEVRARGRKKDMSG